MDGNNVVLEMKSITKAFPGVLALNSVDIDLRGGEVLGILGENGAGKSTLIKILAGVYQMDSGEIIMEGRHITFKNPQDANNAGIRVIYQELNTLEALTIAENIFLGELNNDTILRTVNWRELNKMASEVLAMLDVDLSPKTVMEDLTIAEKQVVEIAKAIWKEAKIIVMDEPTAALSEKDTQTLFNVIRLLKKSGHSIIYISHRLDEIFEITDRVTVLRDGNKIATVNTSKTDRDELIRMMVGRELKDMYPKKKVPIGGIVLEVENLNVEDRLYDISFYLREGEILGIFGLLGSGRTELVNALFGAIPKLSGKIRVNGRVVNIKNPIDARANKLGLVPLDRKNEGLALILSVKENLTLSNIEDLGPGMLINKKNEEQKAIRWINEVNIKTPSILTEISSLSGGNQQKVVLAKWLESGSKIIILNEPTRGIDVGAKVEIYQLMENLCEKGAGIIMVSSELPEILSIADRIIVLNEGKLMAEFKQEEASQEKLMSAACR
ncbi:MAG: sugar ABC transporter ATP-binding protein [Actinobacteria bacterium]|nr:sugar ABC transporter ATP-binding protein [Actinomycetota bacterium]